MFTSRAGDRFMVDVGMRDRMVLDEELDRRRRVAKADDGRAEAKAAAVKREREETTARELAAAERDLYGAVSRTLRDLVAGYDGAVEPRSPAELAAILREPRPAPTFDQPPEQVSWIDLNRALEHNPDAAQAQYAAIKDAARNELLTGLRAARAIEGRPGTPYERAQFAVILEQFRWSYQPQHGAEDLLVQQMAVCFEKYLRWQAVESHRSEEEEWAAHRDRRRIMENMSPRDRDRYEQEHGYMPPRLSGAEAIDQAALNAERYLRSFRGLLRTFQQMRNRLGTVIVTGGTLNVGERQMVIAGCF